MRVGLNNVNSLNILKSRKLVQSFEEGSSDIFGIQKKTYKRLYCDRLYQWGVRVEYRSGWKEAWCVVKQVRKAREEERMMYDA